MKVFNVQPHEACILRVVKPAGNRNHVVPFH